MLYLIKKIFLMLNVIFLNDIQGDILFFFLTKEKAKIQTTAGPHVLPQRHVLAWPMPAASHVTLPSPRRALYLILRWLRSGHRGYLLAGDIRTQQS